MKDWIDLERQQATRENIGYFQFFFKTFLKPVIYILQLLSILKVSAINDQQQQKHKSRSGILCQFGFCQKHESSYSLALG